jgi:hypothetical protein
LAQQGSPPRRPGRHSAPAPEPDPYGAEPYEEEQRDSRGPGADPYAADPYAADPYAADAREADPRGARSYGAPDETYAPVPRDPYAPRGDEPYGREDPYGARDPRLPGPRGADPSAADPYGADPYGADPYGADPRGADPRGADPRGSDSRGGDAYRGRRAAPERDPAPASFQPEPPRAAAAAAQRAPAPPAPAPAGPGRRSASEPGTHPGRVSPWQQNDPFTGDDDEADLPPWAGLTVRPARAAGPKARPARDQPEAGAAEAEADSTAAEPRRRGLGRGRAAATRLRRSRRRVYVYCGTAVVLAIAVAAFFALRALPKHAAAPSFVTTLQAGEFATVPSACGSVSPDLLTTYLPGKVTPVDSSGTSATDSQCSLTVDHKPVFRVLEVTSQAFQPSAVAAGNGSATDNAIDSYVVAEQALRAPGKKAALPPAQITPVTGLGTEALSALQVVHSSPVTNDLVTVMVRQRNLVVTVTFQAQASGSGFGPVDISTLQAGALATARAVLQKDTARAGRG